MDLKKYIRSIQDYPKKGILFRDITTLIKNKDAFRDCIDQMSKILSKVKEIEEFNIGHFIIGESIFDGFKKVIKKFTKLSNN